MRVALWTLALISTAICEPSKLTALCSSPVAKALHGLRGRDYNAAITHNEKKDLRFILRSLAHHSLIKISWNSSSIKKAGDRLEHLHPFKFLESIFTDSELSDCVARIKGRSWVWKEFLDGITDSLHKESSCGNLKGYLKEFAERLHIDIKELQPSFYRQRWKEFVGIIIAHKEKW